ncbi:hypothetical protein [Streptomyces sp. NPDC049879]|uniref:hypothetical protein n=1 Tax=Streptomyces sp. NPDC049879 TaxID=3365598 RepID=UPI0037AB2619
MGILRRSTPSGAVSTADPARVRSARSALSSFARDAGPVSTWTDEQRTEHGRLVSEAQHAELDID